MHRLRQPLQNWSHAGEGNASNVVVSFVPQTVEIKAGESITWDNPTTVPEPHSVTFLKDKKYFADYAAPFQVVNSTEFQPLDPKSNSEPVFAPLSRVKQLKPLLQ
jgi:plastocyanin